MRAAASGGLSVTNKLSVVWRQSRPTGQMRTGVTLLLSRPPDRIVTHKHKHRSMLLREWRQRLYSTHASKKYTVSQKRRSAFLLTTLTNVDRFSNSSLLHSDLNFQQTPY